MSSFHAKREENPFRILNCSALEKLSVLFETIKKMCLQHSTINIYLTWGI